MRNIKPLYYLYYPYKFLIYAPTVAVATMLATGFLVLSSFIFKEKFGYLFGKIWGKVNSYAVPMFVTMSGEENIDKNQSYIVVANHQSLLDITAIYGWLPVEFRWVMKQELRKVPFLGYYCYVAGHVFVNRKSNDAAVKSINEAKQRIKDGVCLLFFAEGTRSDTREMLPFKKGAFKFALDMDLPILPVTVDGSGDVLPNNTIDLFPGKCHLTIHKPISTEAYNQENLEELMGETRAAIQSGLDAKQ